MIIVFLDYHVKLLTHYQLGTVIKLNVLIDNCIS